MQPSYLNRREFFPIDPPNTPNGTPTWLGIAAQREFRLASDGDNALVSFNFYPSEDFSFAMELRRLQR